MSKLYLPHELSFKVVVELGVTGQISRERFLGLFPCSLLWRRTSQYISPNTHLPVEASAAFLSLHSVPFVTQLFHLLLISVKINKLWFH